jgi:hypothetical protein
MSALPTFKSIRAAKGGVDMSRRLQLLLVGMTVLAAAVLNGSLPWGP